MRIVDGFLVYDLPGSNVLDMDQINNIVLHTHNTWQADRPIEEIRKNTLQGKMAEYVVENHLRNNSGYRYESYDSIRIDDYKKHAPFDGIIYSSTLSNEILQRAKNAINNDVANSAGDTGLITVNTRKNLENSGIYMMEIKSSLLRFPRDYKTMTHKKKLERTNEDYRQLCGHIKSFYDYFVYPHYCRNNRNIGSFYDYVSYYSQDHPRESSLKEYLSQLIETEFNNACTIYTRVFIDVLSNEIIVPGYVMKGRFYEEPRIKKMPSDKSINAIYYMYHMRYGKSFLEIDKDKELGAYDGTAALDALFAKKNQICTNCGEYLDLIDLKKYEKFLYHCKKCNKWYSMKETYPRNME
jgi:hypothetical protein